MHPKDRWTTTVTTGMLVTEGRATRIYARINEDGTLTSAVIPDHMRKSLTESGHLNHLNQEFEKDVD